MMTTEDEMETLFPSDLNSETSRMNPNNKILEVLLQENNRLAKENATLRYFFKHVCENVELRSVGMITSIMAWCDDHLKSKYFGVLADILDKSDAGQNLFRPISTDPIGSTRTSPHASTHERVPSASRSPAMVNTGTKRGQLRSPSRPVHGTTTPQKVPHEIIQVSKDEYESGIQKESLPFASSSYSEGYQSQNKSRVINMSDGVKHGVIYEREIRLSSQENRTSMNDSIGRDTTQRPYQRNDVDQYARPSTDYGHVETRVITQTEELTQPSPVEQVAYKSISVEREESRRHSPSVMSPRGYSPSKEYYRQPSPRSAHSPAQTRTEQKEQRYSPSEQLKSRRYSPSRAQETQRYSETINDEYHTPRRQAPSPSNRPSSATRDQRYSQSEQPQSRAYSPSRETRFSSPSKEISNQRYSPSRDSRDQRRSPSSGAKHERYSPSTESQLQRNSMSQETSSRSYSPSREKSRDEVAQRYSPSRDSQDRRRSPSYSSKTERYSPSRVSQNQRYSPSPKTQMRKYSPFGNDGDQMIDISTNTQSQRHSPTKNRRTPSPSTTRRKSPYTGKNEEKISPSHAQHHSQRYSPSKDRSSTPPLRQSYSPSADNRRSYSPSRHFAADEHSRRRSPARDERRRHSPSGGQSNQRYSPSRDLQSSDLKQKRYSPSKDQHGRRYSPSKQLPQQYSTVTEQKSQRHSPSKQTHSFFGEDASQTQIDYTRSHTDDVSQFERSISRKIAVGDPIATSTPLRKSILEVIQRPVDKELGLIPSLNEEKLLRLESGKQTRRILGEIAFQLDRRILEYVFIENVQTRRHKRRFYGYTIANVGEKIRKESTDNRGILDPRKELLLRRRFDDIIRTLGKFGYMVDIHSGFSLDMVNKYGLLQSPPDQEMSLAMGLDDPAILRLVVCKFLRGRDRENELILLDCLMVLAHVDKKPTFLW